MQLDTVLSRKDADMSNAGGICVPARGIGGDGGGATGRASTTVQPGEATPRLPDQHRKRYRTGRGCNHGQRQRDVGIDIGSDGGGG